MFTSVRVFSCGLKTIKALSEHVSSLLEVRNMLNVKIVVEKSSTSCCLWLLTDHSQFMYLPTSEEIVLETLSEEDIAKNDDYGYQVQVDIADLRSIFLGILKAFEATDEICVKVTLIWDDCNTDETSCPELKFDVNCCGKIIEWRVDVIILIWPKDLVNHFGL